MSKRWDMARAASRRELPKPRKMHGPVGIQPVAIRFSSDPHCEACGYHVCCCKKTRVVECESVSITIDGKPFAPQDLDLEAPQAFTETRPVTIAITSIQSSAFDEISAALAKAFADGRFFIA